MSDLFASDEVAAASKRERPSLHSDTDIYRAVAELGKVVTIAAVNMPREAKPIVGSRLVDEVTWMGVLVRRTNIARDAAKLPHLEELLEQVEIVQFDLRVARECRYLPNSAFVASLPLTIAVAKQALALRNHFAPAP
jgi:hypothetical protein